MAAAPPDQAQLRRARTSDQSDRAGLDAVLRGVLQLRAASLPGAHQCLPDALDPQEIQAAATLPQGPGVLAAHHPPTPQALRPLGKGPHRLVTRMTRAV